MTINRLKQLLYKSINDNGLNHKTTVKISKQLDRLILKDTKDNSSYIRQVS